jgi:2,4-dienoyl-CoA reductase (NADPH2)
MKRDRSIEGVSADEALAIKRAVRIPVISTGGWQSRSLVEAHLARGAFDAVAIARPLVANPNLVEHWQSGRDVPPVPCTFCNKCLLNAPKNPIGCYEPRRFGGSRDRMIENILSVYRSQPAPAVQDA